MQRQTKDKAVKSRGGSGNMPLSTAIFVACGAAVAIAAVTGVVWGLNAESTSRQRSRVREVRGATSMLEQAVEHTVGSGESDLLPEILSAAARTHELTTCRLRVPNDATVAEAGKKAEGHVTIPEDLLMPVKRREVVQGDVATFEVPVHVSGKGDLLLEVSASVDAPYDWSMLRLGMPVVFATGLVGLLLAQRAVSSRLKTLGTISRALEVSATERDGSALTISDEIGGMARAWNAIVSERDALRRFAAFKESVEAVQVGGVSSDLAAACDVLTQGILILDERLRVKYANGAAATLLGVKREGMEGSDVRTLVIDSEVVGALEGLATGKVRQRLSVESSRMGPQGRSAEAGGDRQGSVLRFSARPVRREEHGVVMVVVEDVTQQKVADEARNSFVAQATHELRTPLTNIRLYTEAMIESGDDAEMRTKSLNVISSESRRLERIVADMLSVSEIEAGTLKIVRGDVRLDQLFDELRDDYRVMAEDKEIKLVFELPPKLPVVTGDRDKLALAMHNLIANAIKYTPAGGQVTVRVEETPGHFLTHVIDNGIGVKPEEQELIFDRFYRAKDNRVTSVTGTGLGLTLARDIARLHGGEISVRSEINQGSTFTLDLPTIQEGVAARAA